MPSWKLEGEYLPEVFEEVGLKIRERAGRPAIEDDFPDFPKVRLLCFWKNSHEGGGGQRPKMDTFIHSRLAAEQTCWLD